MSLRRQRENGGAGDDDGVSLTGLLVIVLVAFVAVCATYFVVRGRR